MDRWLRVLRAGRLSVGLVEDRAHRGGDERLSCLGHLGEEVADETYEPLLLAGVITITESAPGVGVASIAAHPEDGRAVETDWPAP